MAVGEKVRWGIIGCGDIAESQGAPAMREVPRSSLRAVMSRSIDKARDFAERHGAETAYDSVDELLADPEVDVAYVATPPSLHAELTAKAARAGKHVLCEKPMALDAGECEAMIDACKEAGVELMIAYYRRFFPVVRKMRELLQEGAIGEPVYVRFLYSSFYRREGDWRVEPGLSGGGCLQDVGSHRLDLVSYLFGAPEKVSAFADTFDFDFPVDDSSAAVLRYERGLYGLVHFFWRMKRGFDEVDIGGTEGRILCTQLSAGELKVFRGAECEQMTIPHGGKTHFRLIEDFVNCLTEGRPNSIPGEEGMKATQIIEAIYQSSATGQTVQL